MDFHTSQLYFSNMLWLDWQTLQTENAWENLLWTSTAADKRILRGWNKKLLSRAVLAKDRSFQQFSAQRTDFSMESVTWVQMSLLSMLSCKDVICYMYIKHLREFNLLLLIYIL